MVDIHKQAMRYYDVFDFLTPYKQPSVYVISDSEMRAWKTKQARAEVVELKRLVDYHKTQAERLEEQVLKLEAEYQLSPSAKDN